MWKGDGGEAERQFEFDAWGGSSKSKAEIKTFPRKQTEEINFQRTYTLRRNNRNSVGKINTIPERI